MAPQLPGTRSLRVLASAGKHLNFSRAAADLGLTPAAVSHQIKEMEDQLGLLMFARTSRTIRLTEAGEVMYEAAVDTLDLLGRAAAKARKLSRGVSQLRLTTEGLFASKWLLPRLDRFRRDCPGIDLRFDISERLRSFEQDDIDVAVRFGAGSYPGLVCNRLFDNMIVPVCSPRLLKEGLPLNNPRDLFHHTLAQIEWSQPGASWPNWRMWMAAAGIPDFDDGNCLIFEASTYIIQAAIEGSVVALCDSSMVATDLAEGRLVRPFEFGIKMAPEYAYHLVYPAGMADEPRIVAFRDWILNEARLTPTHG